MLRKMLGTLSFLYIASLLADAQVHVEILKPNHIYNGKPLKNPSPYLYCYLGRDFTYLGVFSSARLEFILPPEAYDLYQGANESQVVEEYTEHKPNWLPLVPWRSNSISFPPFEKKCIGIESTSEYRFKFRRSSIDYYRLLVCVCAILLFFHAKNIVRSRTVFYSGGVSLGVIASIIAIVFILSRMIPQKKAMFVSLMLGWSFSVYIFHKIWTNLYEVLSEHRTYLLAYMGISAIVSFALCYRCGPPSNEKTIDLMQWLVQFVALCGVYFSSDIQEVTLAICLVVLVFYNMPPSLSSKVQTFVKKKIFKPKIKLITEEEYMQQGDEVTRIELEKLRKFAQSPDCSAWKVMSRLKNPQRFGSFVMGESHLEDSEILEYETSGRAHEEFTLLTDDDSEDDEISSTTNGNGNAIR